MNYSGSLLPEVRTDDKKRTQLDRCAEKFTDTTVVVVPGKYLPELKVPDSVVSMEVAVDEVGGESHIQAGNCEITLDVGNADQIHQDRDPRPDHPTYSKGQFNPSTQ